jgi:hypothetical protein
MKVGSLIKITNICYTDLFLNKQVGLVVMIEPSWCTTSLIAKVLFSGKLLNIDIRDIELYENW